MKNRRDFLLAATAAAVVPAIAEAAAPVFPPVKELERQLPCPPGAALPKLIDWAGRRFQPVYLHTVQQPGGIYQVTLKLV
jgi:hypothetical protein